MNTSTPERPRASSVTFQGDELVVHQPRFVVVGAQDVRLVASVAVRARAIPRLGAVDLVIEAAGGFDERYFLYWEDADLCRRLRGAGHTVRYVPSATVVHIGGRSSASAA